MFTDLFTNIAEVQDDSSVYLEVVLHSPPFVPGQPITGEVTIRNKLPIEVEKVGLDWLGEEDVVWYQGLFQNERVAGKKQWLDDRQLIFPLTEGEGSKSLAPGSHILAFAWNLPERLPGSFHDFSSQDMILADNNVFRTFDTNRFPHIQYILSAYVEFRVHSSQTVTAEEKVVPKRLRVEKSVEFFVVESYIASNLERDAISRLVDEDSFFFGKMKISLSVQNGGIVLAGSPIHLEVFVENQSRFEIQEIQLFVSENRLFEVPSGDSAIEKVSNGTNRQLETFSRTIDLISVLLKDSYIPQFGARKTFTKKLMVQPKEELYCTPSIGFGQFTTVEHEIALHAITIVKVIKIKIPLKILVYSSHYRALYPENLLAEYTGQITKFQQAKLEATRAEEERRLREEEEDRINEEFQYQRWLAQRERKISASEMTKSDEVAGKEKEGEKEVPIQAEKPEETAAPLVNVPTSEFAIESEEKRELENSLPTAVIADANVEASVGNEEENSLPTVENANEETSRVDETFEAVQEADTKPPVQELAPSEWISTPTPEIPETKADAKTSETVAKIDEPAHETLHLAPTTNENPIPAELEFASVVPETNNEVSPAPEPEPVIVMDSTPEVKSTAPSGATKPREELPIEPVQSASLVTETLIESVSSPDIAEEKYEIQASVEVPSAGEKTISKAVEETTPTEDKSLNEIPTTPVMPLEKSPISSISPTPQSPSTPSARLKRTLSISGSEPVCPHCEVKIYFQELKESDHKTGQRFHAKCLPLYHEKQKRVDKERQLQLLQQVTQSDQATNDNASEKSSRANVRAHRSASTSALAKKPATGPSSSTNSNDDKKSQPAESREHVLSFSSAFAETGLNAVKSTPQKLSAIDRPDPVNANEEKHSASVTGGFRSTLLNSAPESQQQSVTSPTKPPNSITSSAPLSATPSRASSSRASFQRQQTICPHCSKAIYTSEMSQTTKDGKKYHNNCYNAFLNAQRNNSSLLRTKSSSLEVQCEVVSVDEQGKSVSTWQALAITPSRLSQDEQQTRNASTVKSTRGNNSNATTQSSSTTSELNSSKSQSVAPEMATNAHVTRVKRSQSANSPLPSPMKLAVKPIELTANSIEKKEDAIESPGKSSPKGLLSSPSQKKSFYSFHFANEEKIQRNFVSDSDRIEETVVKLMKKRNWSLEDYSIVDFDDKTQVISLQSTFGSLKSKHLFIQPK